MNKREPDTPTVTPIGCGDNGCEFHTPKVGTNGGCRCLKHIRPVLERYAVTAKVRNLGDRLRLATAMLQRFASLGEQLWDETDFRDGYKQIPSGDLVDCRSLLRQLGVTEFDE